MPERVECYSGHSYGERPRAFLWQGQRHQVVEIISRWRSPGGWGFQVRTWEAQVFELAYSEHKNEWQIDPLPGVKPTSTTRKEPP